MTSMSLSFILCESDEEAAPRTRQQRKKKSGGSSAELQTNQEDIPSAEASSQRSVAHRRDKDGSLKSKTSKTTTTSERQQHVRQLQNQRQRRYRERKKSTASALKTNADQLHQENGALESAILEYFKS